MIPSEPLLSPNDAHVLSTLFNPESPPSTTVKVDPSLPPLPHLTTDELSALQSATRAAIAPLAVPQPAKPAIAAAIAALTALITAHPTYAPAYTNRAQAARLAIDDAQLFAPAHAAELEAILADLARAVELATPLPSGSAVSPAQANLLATAHAHRAYLYLRGSKAAAAAVSGSGLLETGPVGLRGLSRERLEEMASMEFEAAGRFGDRLAREMAVRTNPYAKMCGAIVRGALREEQEG
ncbi:hypothetical protein AOQ84DRAFT_342990, partial [Glonium stellatum]